MAFNVKLSEKDQDELYALKAQPYKPSKLQGSCAECGRGIPVGYLAVVTRWSCKTWGSFKVMVPEVLYCRNCGAEQEGTPKHRRRFPVPPRPGLDPAAEPELTLKELAMKVFPEVSATEGRGSRTLARMAGLDSTSEELVERVKLVMKKLKDAGKVSLVDGKWVKA